MRLSKKQKASALTAADQRLRLQYRAMINQVILIAAGIALVVMSFHDRFKQDSRPILFLCGSLLILMGAIRVGLCYHLLQEADDNDDSDYE